MTDKKELKLEEIEGLGEKKAQQLRDELGIDNVQELEEALADGRVDALDGFGPKTIENIEKALAEIEEVGEEEEAEEIPEFVIDEPIAEEPVIEESVVKESKPFATKKITNRDVDVLFGDVSARVRDKYDEILITADRHYVRDKRINFLFALVSNMAKKGAIIKFPEEFFNDMPGAHVEDGFWMIEKGE